MIELPMHVNVFDMLSYKTLLACYLFLSASFQSYILSILQKNFPCMNTKGQTNITFISTGHPSVYVCQFRI